MSLRLKAFNNPPLSRQDKLHFPQLALHKAFLIQPKAFFPPSVSATLHCKDGIPEGQKRSCCSDQSTQDLLGQSQLKIFYTNVTPLSDLSSSHSVLCAIPESTVLCCLCSGRSFTRTSTPTSMTVQVPPVFQSTAPVQPSKGGLPTLP